MFGDGLVQWLANKTLKNVNSYYRMTQYGNSINLFPQINPKCSIIILRFQSFFPPQTASKFNLKKLM